MKASIVIPVWNGRQYLPACLEALLLQEGAAFEIIAVDNASSDGSDTLLAEQYPQVQLIRNRRNLGFAGGCNVGLRVAQGDILILLNQDTVVLPGWLLALTEAFTDTRVGIVGVKILEPDGRTLSHVGGYLEWPAVLGRHIGAGEVDHGQYDVKREVEYVTGASLAIRRATLDQIGPLDEQLAPVFFEDTDWCWRARKAGWLIQCEPRAVVFHDEASSTRHHWLSRHYYYYRNRYLFLLKHFSAAEILTAFVPAERARMLQLPPEELRAERTALTEILALYSGWPAAADREEKELLREAFVSLRELSVHRLGGDSPRIRPPATRESQGKREQLMIGQDPNLDEMTALWEVKEPAFTSQVPILGRLIVAFRNVWNSVATKWYVRPMVSQQVQFNGATVRAVAQLHAVSWDSDSLLELLAERIAELELRLMQIEARSVISEDNHEQ